MRYEKEEYFEGELAKAIEVAKNTFLPNGFEILNINEKQAFENHITGS